MTEDFEALGSTPRRVEERFPTLILSLSLWRVERLKRRRHGGAKQNRDPERSGGRPAGPAFEQSLLQTSG